MKSVQCPLLNMSIFKFAKTFNFHNILFLRCLNYPDQLSVTINYLQCKEIYTQTSKEVFKGDTEQERHTENSKVKFDKK